jgi:alpha-1,3-mannosyltransferase
MRVCHVVRQFHPSVGGLEKFVATLTAELGELGCVCEVLTLDRVLRTGAKLAAEQTIGGLRVRRVPMLGYPRYFVPQISRDDLADFDVIHVHGVDGMFDRIARHRRFPGQVLVATSHGLFFHTRWMAPVKAVYLHTATRWAARNYDLLLANSRADAGRMRSVAANVVHLPNGITPLGSFRAGGHDVLCLGRLARHKHVARIIRALAMPELRGVRLHVVGPEWDVTRFELARLAERLGVRAQVFLHGQVDAPSLALIASRCGLFASASRYEGFGMSLIEAMSVGLVPVVEANASFVELLDAAPCGACVDFSSPQMAARAMRRTLDALDEGARDAAIAHAARYSWSGHALATLDLYHRAHKEEPAFPACAQPVR